MLAAKKTTTHEQMTRSIANFLFIIKYWFVYTELNQFNFVSIESSFSINFL